MVVVDYCSVYLSIRIADISERNSLISLAIATLDRRAGEVGVGTLDVEVRVEVVTVAVTVVCPPFNGLNA